MRIAACTMQPRLLPRGGPDGRRLGRAGGGTDLRASPPWPELLPASNAAGVTRVPSTSVSVTRRGSGILSRSIAGCGARGVAPPGRAPSSGGSASDSSSELSNRRNRSLGSSVMVGWTILCRSHRTACRISLTFFLPASVFVPAIVSLVLHSPWRSPPLILASIAPTRSICPSYTRRPARSSVPQIEQPSRPQCAATPWSRRYAGPRLLRPR